MQLRYQLPSYEELEGLDQTLGKGYKGKNPHRIDFIKLLSFLFHDQTFLSSDEKIKLLTGYIIFELEAIENEYKMISPLLQKGYIYNSGSQLYTDLYNKLGLEENKLSDDERLIYLFKFYRYAETNLPNEVFKELHWKSKSVFLEQLREKMKKIKTREYSRIELFSQGTPKLEALQRNLTSVKREYQQAASSRWFSNTKRDNAVNLISFINQACEYHANTSEPDPEGKENRVKDYLYIESVNIRMGLIIYVLNDIHNEYMLRSASNSELYCQCLEAINVKSINEIKPEIRLTALRALSNYIEYIRNTPYFETAMVADWQKHVLANLPKIQEKIATRLAEEERDRKKPSWARKGIVKTSSWMMNIGFGYVFIRNAMLIATPLIPIIGGAAAAALTGPIGMVFLGGGTILATQLGLMVQERIIPGAVANIYQKALEKIASSISNTAADMAIKTFSITGNGLLNLFGYYKEKTGDTFLEEWVDTLLNLPDDVISEEEKRQIRRGLEAEENKISSPAASSI